MAVGEELRAALEEAREPVLRDLLIRSLGKRRGDAVTTLLVELLQKGSHHDRVSAFGVIAVRGESPAGLSALAFATPQVIAKSEGLVARSAVFAAMTGPRAHLDFDAGAKPLLAALFIGFPGGGRCRLRCSIDDWSVVLESPTPSPEIPLLFQLPAGADRRRLEIEVLKGEHAEVLPAGLLWWPMDDETQPLR